MRYYDLAAATVRMEGEPGHCIKYMKSIEVPPHSLLLSVLLFADQNNFITTNRKTAARHTARGLSGTEYDVMRCSSPHSVAPTTHTQWLPTALPE
jgi:hypothetical protein